MIVKAEVTSQHSIHKNNFTALYKGKRYDFNTISGKAYFQGVNDKGSYSIEVKSESLKLVIENAVKEYILNMM